MMPHIVPGNLPRQKICMPPSAIVGNGSSGTESFPRAASVLDDGTQPRGTEAARCRASIRDRIQSIPCVS